MVIKDGYMIRAIYEHGNLRLLDTVNLREGQTVNIAVLPDVKLLEPSLEEIDHPLYEASLLADIHLSPEEEAMDDISDEELTELGKQFTGKRSSDELIDEDRGSY